MRPGTANSISAQRLTAAAARGELNKSLPRQLYRHGPEEVTLALLAASKCIAEQEGSIAATLKTCLQTSQLPPLPDPIAVTAELL